ncbi:MAG: hypothetical protein LBM13_00380, partial [Candidatus Ancillula sp.]|nr:hypothetical protein [Candidatus Ancillula sp.]
VPTKSGLLENITKLSAGGNHTCAITSDKQAYCWGDNTSNVLGTTNIVQTFDKNGYNNISPFSKLDSQTFEINLGGLGNKDGQNQLGGTFLKLNSFDLINVSWSNYHHWAGDPNVELVDYDLSVDGSSCQKQGGGSGYMTQSGNWQSSFQFINCNNDNVDSMIWDSSTLNLTVKTKQRATFSTGNSYFKFFDRITGGQMAITEIRTPDEFNPLVLTGVQRDNSGFLSNISDIVTGVNHTCAIADIDHKLYCWGSDSYGQISNNLNIGSSLTPNKVTYSSGSQLANVSSVVVGVNHTCILTDQKKVLCFGDNSLSQIGKNTGGGSSQTPVGTFDSSGYHAVSANQNLTGNFYIDWNSFSPSGVGSGGMNYGCALMYAGFNVLCNRGYSAMVIDGGSQYAGSTFINYSSKSFPSTFSMNTSGFAISWDYQHKILSFKSSNLGTFRSSYYSSYIFKSSAGYISIYDGVYQPPSAYVQAGAQGSGDLSNVISISAGANHTCALDESGHTYCWGDNTYWQLGVSYPSTSNSPVSVYAGSSAPAGTSSSDPISNVVSINSGGSHTCAILNNQNTYCWGGNNVGPYPVKVVGQNEPALSVSIGDDISSTGSNSNICVITSNKKNALAGTPNCWVDIYSSSVTPAVYFLPDNDGNLIKASSSDLTGFKAIPIMIPADSTGLVGLQISQTSKDYNQVILGAEQLSDYLRSYNLKPGSTIFYLVPAPSVSPISDNSNICSSVDMNYVKSQSAPFSVPLGEVLTDGDQSGSFDLRQYPASGNFCLVTQTNGLVTQNELSLSINYMGKTNPSYSFGLYTSKSLAPDNKIVQSGEVSTTTLEIDDKVWKNNKSSYAMNELASDLAINISLGKSVVASDSQDQVISDITLSNNGPTDDEKSTVALAFPGVTACPLESQSHDIKYWICSYKGKVIDNNGTPDDISDDFPEYIVELVRKDSTPFKAGEINHLNWNFMTDPNDYNGLIPEGPLSVVGTIDTGKHVDSDLSNNNDSENLMVYSTPIEDPYVKTIKGIDEVNQGGEVSYTFEYGNKGNKDTTAETKIVFQYPQDFDFSAEESYPDLDNDPETIDCINDVNNNELSCELGPLALGKKAGEITIKGKVKETVDHEQLPKEKILAIIYDGNEPEIDITNNQDDYLTLIKNALSAAITGLVRLKTADTGNSGESRDKQALGIGVSGAKICLTSKFRNITYSENDPENNICETSDSKGQYSFNKVKSADDYIVEIIPLVGTEPLNTFGGFSELPVVSDSGKTAVPGTVNGCGKYDQDLLNDDRCSENISSITSISEIKANKPKTVTNSFQNIFLLKLKCSAGTIDDGSGHCIPKIAGVLNPKKPDLNDDVNLTLVPDKDVLDLGHDYKYTIGLTPGSEDVCPLADLDIISGNGSTCLVDHFPVGKVHLYWTIIDQTSAKHETFEGELEVNHYRLVYNYEGGELDSKTEPTYPETNPEQIPQDHEDAYYYLTWGSYVSAMVKVAQQRNMDNGPKANQYIYADSDITPIGPKDNKGNNAKFVNWCPFGTRDKICHNSGDLVDLVLVAGENNYRVEYDASYKPVAVPDVPQPKPTPTPNPKPKPIIPVPNPNTPDVKPLIKADQQPNLLSETGFNSLDLVLILLLITLGAYFSKKKKKCII